MCKQTDKNGEGNNAYFSDFLLCTDSNNIAGVLYLHEYRTFTLSYLYFSRSQIISLLLEVPGHCLPLFKFRELFESRYLTSISMSDMYKMKDVCLISEDSTGRMVILNPDHRNTPSPVFPTTQVNSACFFSGNN
jgi:hypothetical protein